MALTNMVSQSGYLLSIGENAEGISETVTQELVQTDFIALERNRVMWQLPNISSPTSFADNLICSDVQDGDELLIRTSDNTLHTMIVSGTTLVDTAMDYAYMRSNTFPAGIVSGTNDPGNAWKIMDGSLGSRTYLSWPSSVFTFQLPNNDLKQYNKYFFKAQDNSGGNLRYSIEASTNGVDYTEISPTQNIIANGVYSIQSPGMYSYYRIRGYDHSYGYQFTLLGDGVQIDTSAITNGETPSNVYLLKNTIKYRGTGVPSGGAQTEMIRNNISINEIQSSHGSFFFEYDDVHFPNDTGDGGLRECITTVTMAKPGTVVTNLNGYLQKALPVVPSFSVSKATAVNNAVTVHFPTDILATGDLTQSCVLEVFNGTNTVTVTPDTATPGTDLVVFNFPANTIMHGDVVKFVYNDTKPLDKIKQVGTLIELSAGNYDVINTVP